MEALKALTALDGRYQWVTAGLQDIFSEFGLMKYRMFVEIQWLKFLADDLELLILDAQAHNVLDEIVENFDLTAARRIKEIEQTTNHDVKAVEYFIKERLVAGGLEAIQEWTHFSCTSEDINNTAYALMWQEGRKYLNISMRQVLERLETLAQETKSVPMMARTHGQPASPTTVGKEFINFAWRIRQELDGILDVDIQAKMNGATGNYNAHAFVYPDIDWVAAGQRFIRYYLKLTPLLWTVQINPNHALSQLLHGYIRLSSTLIDLDRDMWGYISLGYFKQKLKEGEVGSSTMPHKVNPIDFENAEGNLGLGIALMEHLAVKLLNSRFQRDLTDSTVLRNCGAIAGYLVIGACSTLKGLKKIELNKQMLVDDLEANWELLAEPIQTVMRVYGEKNPYEALKSLTRGVKVDQAALAVFIDGLAQVPEEVKKRMKALSPATYIGKAEVLVQAYFNKIKG